MSAQEDVLGDFAQVAQDGIAFYESARSQVTEPEIREVFSRMVEAKKALLADLAEPLAQSGKAIPKLTTVSGAIRELYVDIRALLASNNEAVYVAQLEKVEDRLLSDVRGALRETVDPVVRARLQVSLPRMRACHDEMRSLKQRLGA